MSRRAISWRWRLVLIMNLVSGLALCSFIAISWKVVAISSLQRLDAEMVATSLKEGWPFMLSMYPERTRPPVPPGENGEEEPAGHAFSFYYLPNDRAYPGPDWPEDLDPLAIGRQIPGLYPKQGKQLAQLRLFTLPDQPPGERIPPADRRLRRPPRHQLPSLDQAVFLTVPGEEENWRIMGYSNGVGVLLMANSMESIRKEMAGFRRAVLFSLPAALLVIAVVAWYFAGKAVGPVRRLTAAAAGVTAEGLDKRLNKEGAYPEFADLIEVYNAMLARLESSFEQSRRFSADAAHELNTPLTILQGHLDLMAQSEGTGPEEQQQLATIIEEVHNLREVVRKLLLLSLADSGKLPLDLKEFDLSSMTEDIMEDAGLISPNLRIERRIEKGVHVNGDRDLIRQTLLNVVSNAIKYNRADGYVQLVLRRSGNWIEIEVTNAGEAIPQATAEKLFERFFRGDSARLSSKAGRGLGLSLAREFVRAHQGSLTLERNHNDEITFLIRLPLGSMQTG